MFVLCVLVYVCIFVSMGSLIELTLSLYVFHTTCMCVCVSTWCVTTGTNQLTMCVLHYVCFCVRYDELSMCVYTVQVCNVCCV